MNEDVTAWRELAEEFIKAVRADNMDEARRIGCQLYDDYPELTDKLHLFLDMANAVNGVG